MVNRHIAGTERHVLESTVRMTQRKGTIARGSRIHGLIKKTSSSAAWAAILSDQTTANSVP